MTEREFLSQVLELARLRGWRSLHVRPARTLHGWRTPCQGDGAGFPDLLLLKGSTIIAAELKIGKNKPTPEQQAWLDSFALVGVPAYLWTPASWEEIVSILSEEIA